MATEQRYLFPQADRLAYGGLVFGLVNGFAPDGDPCGCAVGLHGGRVNVYLMSRQFNVLTGLAATSLVMFTALAAITTPLILTIMGVRV